jgi:hypothetical protein
MIVLLKEALMCATASSKCFFTFFFFGSANLVSSVSFVGYYRSKITAAGYLHALSYAAIA